METNSSTSNSNPPEKQPGLLAFWLFILGVLVVEMTARVLPEGYQTRVLVHRSAEVCYQPAPDIQIMGDSATSALSAARIEDALGKKYSIGNYSLPGTSPMFAYFLFKRQLDTGKKPKLLVLAPNPYTWTDPMLDRFLGRFATPGESAEFLRDTRDLGDWTYGTAARASYTLRYREELYKAVTSADTEFFRTWDRPVSPIQNTATMIFTRRDEPPAPKPSTLDRRNMPPLFFQPVKIHRFNEFYLRKMCALARKNGIQIAWITLPVPEVIGKGPEAEKRGKLYVDLMEKVDADYSDLHVLTHTIRTMPDAEFADGWHMNEHGAWIEAGAISRLLSDWLATRPLR